MYEIGRRDQFSVEHPEVGRRINQIVHALNHLPEWHEDFRQEALIHFTRTVTICPGQTLSWYVQSCKAAIRDRIKQGKSLDSLKRRNARCLIEDEAESDDRVVHSDFICRSNPLLEVSVLDAYETVACRLDRQNQGIFRLLFEGYGVREIARKLGIRHQAVSEGRQRIAKIAVQLGIMTGRWF